MRHRGEAAVTAPLSPIVSVAPEIVATARLVVETGWPGLHRDHARGRAVHRRGRGEGRRAARLHAAYLGVAVIQENADPDVRTDLATALDRLAPADAGWVHDVEGPDDMPAHVKTMLTGVSLHVPVIDGALALGTWQGIYVCEHRTRRTGARSCCSSSAVAADAQTVRTQDRAALLLDAGNYVL